MTHEAVKSYSESSGNGDVIQDYTCDDATGIEKGTLLALSDPRTVAAVTAKGQILAGIAAREKVANDGRTQISVHKKGYFLMYASGALVLGEPVIAMGHDNEVTAAPSATATTSGACILGYPEETASDGEQVLIRVDL